jgi:hypothetical protein
MFLERYKEDLSKLIKLGTRMHLDLSIRAMEEGREKLSKPIQEAKHKVAGAFEKDYQKWYTEACVVIRQLLLQRLTEFETFYKADPKRKTFNITAYTIQDWFSGLRAEVRPLFTPRKAFDDLGVVANL